MNWMFVTDEEARQHPLYGFGGWLLVVYGIEVAFFANTIYSIARIAAQAGLDAVLSPGFAAVWLHLALALPFLIMAPLRARPMPLVAIICFWVGAAWSLGNYVMVPGLLADLWVVVPTVLSLAWGVVFTLYLLRSRRVNVTYRLRVREDEAVSAAAAV